MPNPVLRGAAAAGFAILISASSLAHADGAAVPDRIKGVMKSLEVDETSQLAYQDEAGSRVNADEFVKLVRAATKFSLGKPTHQGAALRYFQILIVALCAGLVIRGMINNIIDNNHG